MVPAAGPAQNLHYWPYEHHKLAESWKRFSPSYMQVTQSHTGEQQEKAGKSQHARTVDPREKKVNPIFLESEVNSFQERNQEHVTHGYSWETLRRDVWLNCHSLFQSAVFRPTSMGTNALDFPNDKAAGGKCRTFISKTYAFIHWYIGKAANNRLEMEGQWASDYDGV
ncbi:hypothetical protein FB45DRAFT_1002581 [Roridomyces roridus]|uniref:Uncharacterized protein n=1 Tax=Roridomyces roridus TaxID=1738132 RepID=A0AAD7BZT4_9AGAR|nr:hypothetical protein FB45DRAFT_1002581 [Roridomyces roridus]